MPKYDLAVIIVNYNVKTFLHFCLRSVYAATKNLNTQIIVVDNQSTDGSVNFIKEHHPSVELLPQNSNLGFAKGCNVGIDHSSSKYILFLNPDMTISEDSISACLDLWESKEKPGAVGIKLIDGKGKYLAESKRGNPTIANTFFKQSGLYRLFPKSKYWNGYYLGHLSEDETHEIAVLTGAFLFTSSEVLVDVGYFDEDFFMYGEDIDLSYRMQKKGYKIYYDPLSTAIHFKGESTKKSSIKYYRAFYGSMKKYVDKHYQSSMQIAFSFLLKAGIVISGIFDISKKAFSKIVRLGIDFTVLIFGMYFIGEFWAKYYHKNPGHFEPKQLMLNISIYAFIWISSLLLHSHYDTKNKTSISVKALFRGLIVILILYALLGNSMRNSRAVILFGFFYALLTLPLIKKVFQMLLDSNENNMIITDTENDSLMQILSKKDLTPCTDEKASNQLFTIQNTSFKDIIKAIKSRNSEVLPYFYDKEFQFLISSHDKAKRGESLDSAGLYNLNKRSHIFSKRVFDIITSSLLLFLFPLSLFTSSKKNHYLNNLLQIIKGKQTLISFGAFNHLISDGDGLPQMNEGYWPYTQFVDNEEQLLRMKEYALHYSVTSDAVLLISHFKDLITHLATKG